MVIAALAFLVLMLFLELHSCIVTRI
jgi:hypothetical protein